MTRALAHRVTVAAPAKAEHGDLVRLIRVDIGKAAVRCAVYLRGDEYVIPIEAKLPRGGHMRMVIEVDKGTFERALETARDKGLTAVRLADLAERFIGHRPFFAIEARELPPGGED